MNPCSTLPIAFLSLTPLPFSLLLVFGRDIRRRQTVHPHNIQDIEPGMERVIRDARYGCAAVGMHLLGS